METSLGVFLLAHLISHGWGSISTGRRVITTVIFNLLKAIVVPLLDYNKIVWYAIFPYWFDKGDIEWQM